MRGKTPPIQAYSNDLAPIWGPKRAPKIGLFGPLWEALLEGLKGAKSLL